MDLIFTSTTTWCDFDLCLFIHSTVHSYRKDLHFDNLPIERSLILKSCQNTQNHEYRTRANKGRANYSKNIFQTLDAAIYQERPLIKKYFSS